MFFPYVLSSYLRYGFPFGIFLVFVQFQPGSSHLVGVCATRAVEPVDLFSVDNTFLPVNSDSSAILLTFTTNPNLDRTEHVYLSQLLGNRARLIFSECEEVHWNAVHSSAWVRNPQRIDLHFCLLVGFRTWNLFAVKFIQIEHLQQKAVVKVGEVGCTHV